MVVLDESVVGRICMFWDIPSFAVECDGTFGARELTRAREIRKVLSALRKCSDIPVVVQFPFTRFEHTRVDVTSPLGQHAPDQICGTPLLDAIWMRVLTSLRSVNFCEENFKLAHLYTLGL